MKISSVQHDKSGPVRSSLQGSFTDLVNKIRRDPSVSIPELVRRRSFIVGDTIVYPRRDFASPLREGGYRIGNLINSLNSHPSAPPLTPSDGVAATASTVAREIASCVDSNSRMAISDPDLRRLLNAYGTPGDYVCISVAIVPASGPPVGPSPVDAAESCAADSALVPQLRPDAASASLTTWDILFGFLLTDGSAAHFVATTHAHPSANTNAANPSQSSSALDTSAMQLNVTVKTARFPPTFDYDAGVAAAAHGARVLLSTRTGALGVGAAALAPATRTQVYGDYVVVAIVCGFFREHRMGVAAPLGAGGGRSAYPLFRPPPPGIDDDVVDTMTDPAGVLVRCGGAAVFETAVASVIAGLRVAPHLAAGALLARLPWVGPDGSTFWFPAAPTGVPSHDGPAGVRAAFEAIGACPPLPQMTRCALLDAVARERAIDLARIAATAVGGNPAAVIAARGGAYGTSPPHHKHLDSMDAIRARATTFITTVSDLTECVAYGAGSAEEVAAVVLTCDGNADKACRRAILSTKTSRFGVGAAPHIVWGVVLVIVTGPDGYTDGVTPTGRDVQRAHMASREAAAADPSRHPWPYMTPVDVTPLEPQQRLSLGVSRGREGDPRGLADGAGDKRTEKKKKKDNHGSREGSRGRAKKSTREDKRSGAKTKHKEPERAQEAIARAAAVTVGVAPGDPSRASLARVRIDAPGVYPDGYRYLPGTEPDGAAQADDLDGEPGWKAVPMHGAAPPASVRTRHQSSATASTHSTAPSSSATSRTESRSSRRRRSKRYSSSSSSGSSYTDDSSSSSYTSGSSYSSSSYSSSSYSSTSSSERSRRRRRAKKHSSGRSGDAARSHDRRYGRHYDAKRSSRRSGSDATGSAAASAASVPGHTLSGPLDAPNASHSGRGQIARPTAGASLSPGPAALSAPSGADGRTPSPGSRAATIRGGVRTGIPIADAPPSPFLLSPHDAPPRAGSLMLSRGAQSRTSTSLAPSDHTHHTAHSGAGHSIRGGTSMGIRGELPVDRYHGAAATLRGAPAGSVFAQGPSRRLEHGGAGRAAPHAPHRSEALGDPGAGLFRLSHVPAGAAEGRVMAADAWPAAPACLADAGTKEKDGSLSPAPRIAPRLTEPTGGGGGGGAASGMGGLRGGQPPRREVRRSSIGSSIGGLDLGASGSAFGTGRAIPRDFDRAEQPFGHALPNAHHQTDHGLAGHAEAPARRSSSLASVAVRARSSPAANVDEFSAFLLGDHKEPAAPLSRQLAGYDARSDSEPKSHMDFGPPPRAESAPYHTPPSGSAVGTVGVRQKTTAAGVQALANQHNQSGRTAGPAEPPMFEEANLHPLDIVVRRGSLPAGSAPASEAGVRSQDLYNRTIPERLRGDPTLSSDDGLGSLSPNDNCGRSTPADAEPVGPSGPLAGHREPSMQSATGGFVPHRLGRELDSALERLHKGVATWSVAAAATQLAGKGTAPPPKDPPRAAYPAYLQNNTRRAGSVGGGGRALPGATDGRPSHPAHHYSDVRGAHPPRRQPSRSPASGARPRSVLPDQSQAAHDPHSRHHNPPRPLMVDDDDDVVAAFTAKLRSLGSDVVPASGPSPPSPRGRLGARGSDKGRSSKFARSNYSLGLTGTIATRLGSTRSGSVAGGSHAHPASVRLQRVAAAARAAGTLRGSSRVPGARAPSVPPPGVFGSRAAAVAASGAAAMAAADGIAARPSRRRGDPGAQPAHPGADAFSGHDFDHPRLRSGFAHDSHFAASVPRDSVPQSEGEHGARGIHPLDAITGHRRSAAGSSNRLATARRLGQSDHPGIDDGGAPQWAAQLRRMGSELSRPRSAALDSDLYAGAMRAAQLVEEIYDGVGGSPWRAN